jgi:hypothetical protein
MISLTSAFKCIVKVGSGKYIARPRFVRLSVPFLVTLSIGGNEDPPHPHRRPLSTELLRQLVGLSGSIAKLC